MINKLLSEHKDELVILIDMSWVLYRSHYAFKLTNSDGMETGSFYGLSNTIQILSDNYPGCLILLVDDGNPVERKELNESYKGNREHAVHFKSKRYTVDCMIQPLDNVFRVYHPVMEADDLLFSISKIKDFNNEFIIYSSDKDLYQAIDESTKVSNSISRGQLVTIDEFSDSYTKNFGDLKPFQIPFYRAVLGDASDNLSIIRPRFPSKVAYYFAMNFINIKDGILTVSKPEKKPEDLTENQYNCLLEIYESENFMNNLKIMRLDKKEDIPVVSKDKSTSEVLDMLTYLELRKYIKWLEVV